MPTISGRVVDNDRRPVSKVRVSLAGALVAESAEDGFFSVSLSKAEPRVALSFAASGYVTNTRVCDARTDVKSIFVIWPIAYSVKFDSTRELKIELGGAHIQLPAHALISPDNEKFSGPAELHFTLFDVTNPAQRAAASGDFSGRLLDGTIRRLVSFGIFDLDIGDANGRPLTTRPEANLAVSIPVPRKLVPNAPPKTGFFGFDLNEGRWVQEGDVVLAGHTYNVTLPHSLKGPWNVDAVLQGPYVGPVLQAFVAQCVLFTVNYVGTGKPVPGATFYVVANGKSYDVSGNTNSAGEVCLVVQGGDSISVRAYGLGAYSDYSTPPYAIPTFTALTSGSGDCSNPSACQQIPVPVDIVP